MSETEGQVEICLGGGWHGLCDWSSSYQEARVVCKQLGYPYSGIIIVVLYLNLYRRKYKCSGLH